MDLATFGQSALAALLPYLATAGVTLLGWIGTQAGKWLRAHAHGQAASTGLDVLENLVTTVVTSLEQTVIASMPTGRPMTVADARRLKQNAIGAIREYYGPKGLALLAKSLKMSESAITSLVSDKIEVAVYNLKLPQQRELPVFRAGPLPAAEP